jgi:hypothetical protein
MLTLKPSDKLTLTENYLGGKESPISSDNTRHMFDSVATYTMSPKFSAMANYDYGFDMLAANRRMWQGIAGYGKISFNGKDTGLKLVPRYEYYYDKNGATTGINQKLQEGTLTFQMVSKDAGTFWAEYRRDWSDQEAFLNNKDSGAVPRLNQDIVVIGYTYSFSKEVK